jgi:hypothetical protein
MQLSDDKIRGFRLEAFYFFYSKEQVRSAKQLMSEVCR